MTARVRGWCPSLYEPMEAGDGWLVRVKPPLSQLTAATALGLADAAARFGNGVIEITSRANLQIRGLAPGGFADFAHAMFGLGLAAADQAFERIRNVTVSPLLGDDPGIAPETAMIAADLFNGLWENVNLHALHGKFSFAVDGGGILPVSALWADITLRAADNRWLVIPNGSTQAAIVTPKTAAAAALALARVCLESGSSRMRPLITERSESECFAKAGIQDFEKMSTPIIAAPRPGPYVYRDSHDGGLLVAPRFGQLSSGDLSMLADLATRHGNESIRVTPSRLLAITGLRAGTVAEVSTELRNADMIVDSHDPALNIIACPGSPNCRNGQTSARLDAAYLSRQRPGAFPTLHISGCSKGCAHPRPSQLTLVGGAEGYTLILNGTADGVPYASGLTPAAALQIINQLHTIEETVA